MDSQTPPNSINIQPTPPKSGSVWLDKKHMITYVIVLTGLVVIAVAIYAYQKQIQQNNVNKLTQDLIDSCFGCNDVNLVPNPTANWKTYTNSQYGFEFKYPSGLTYTEELKDTFNNEKWLTTKFFGSDKNISVFSFEINATAFGFAEGCDEKTIQKTLVVNGINMERKDFCGEIMYQFKNIDEFYALNHGRYENQKFDQILSTFKFVEPNWKTYTNTEYGYQISYPPTWTAKDNNDFGSFVTISSPDKRLNITINSKSAYDDGVYRNASESEKKLIDQILSTFKFTK